MLQAIKILTIDSPRRDQLALKKTATVSMQKTNANHVRNMARLVHHVRKVPSNFFGRLFLNSGNSGSSPVISPRKVISLSKKSAPSLITLLSLRTISWTVWMRYIEYPTSTQLAQWPYLLGFLATIVVSMVYNLVRRRQALPAGHCNLVRSAQLGAKYHISWLKMPKHIPALL